MYLLKGSDHSLEEILQGKRIFASFIIELELIGFKSMLEEDSAKIGSLLNDCLIVALNNGIKEKYVEVRRKYHLKLPDAIIAATAISLNMPLITADKQFKTVHELDLVTYEL